MDWHIQHQPTRLRGEDSRRQNPASQRQGHWHPVGMPQQPAGHAPALSQPPLHGERERVWQWGDGLEGGRAHLLPPKRQHRTGLRRVLQLELHPDGQWHIALGMDTERPRAGEQQDMQAALHGRILRLQAFQPLRAGWHRDAGLCGPRA